MVYVPIRTTGRLQFHTPAAGNTHPPKYPDAVTERAQMTPSFFGWVLVGCVPPGAGAVVAVVLTVSTSSFVCVHTNVRTYQNNNKNSITTHKHDHKHKRAQNTKTRKLALIARLASQTDLAPCQNIYQGASTNPGLQAHMGFGRYMYLKRNHKRAKRQHS